MISATLECMKTSQHSVSRGSPFAAEIVSKEVVALKVDEGSDQLVKPRGG